MGCSSEAEQLAVNQRAGGSNPLIPAKKFVKGNSMKLEEAKVGARVRVVSLNNTKTYVGQRGIKIGKTYTIQTVFPSSEKVILKQQIVSMKDVILLDENNCKEKKQIVETFNPEELVMNNDSSDV